jgi:HK97 family phage portal protein
MPIHTSEVQSFGLQNITLYPTNTGETYIKQGYNKNSQVYAIVSKNARKFGQVPFYHYKIKKNERKTWSEYLMLTKHGLAPDNILEAKKMRTKSIDENIVDSDLSRLLKKPNRNESGSLWREKMYGFKMLTGEGNFWINRGESKKEKPKELFIIPKGCLQLKTGSDIWSVGGYQITFGHIQSQRNEDEIVMWLYPTYANPNPTTLEHLRGQSPLDAGLLIMQAANESAERLIAMNKNQGVAGLAFRKDLHDTPTPAQAAFQRQQFNSIVNDKTLAGSIAVMNGEWNYLQFGLDAQKLQLIEQSGASFEQLCNIFDTPPGLFAKDQTYENQREAKRNWVYDNIAPAAYSLRDDLNEKLILQMGLDRDGDFIDCDILSLPELSTDLGKQISALKDASWLTLDEKRTACGYDALNTEESKKIYMPSSLSTIDEVGGSLDNDLKLLGDANG